MNAVPRLPSLLLRPQLGRCAKLDVRHPADPLHGDRRASETWVIETFIGRIRPVHYGSRKCRLDFLARLDRERARPLPESFGIYQLSIKTTSRPSFEP
jgi:hypothetical protein